MIAVPLHGRTQPSIGDQPQMHARQQPEINAAPIQMSLRIRHPAIDPQEISDALELEPEHCFRAGDPRTATAEPGRMGQHAQTYWLASVTTESWVNPIEPQFLAAIAERTASRNVVFSAETLRAASKDFKISGIEGVLMYLLRRLSVRHTFLQRIQNEGGDVSLLIVIERAAAGDFALPLSVSRLLVQLGISIEFKFDA
jgi:hypothetical protein